MTADYTKEVSGYRFVKCDITSRCVLASIKKLNILKVILP